MQNCKYHNLLTEPKIFYAIVMTLSATPSHNHTGRKKMKLKKSSDFAKIISDLTKGNYTQM